jgi:hypothetical protein
LSINIDIVHFNWQICVARKKQLLVYNVTEEKLSLIKDIGVPEPALGVSVDGSHICAALLTRYTVYNFDTNFTQQLFTYGCETFLPIIRRITKVCLQSDCIFKYPTCDREQIEDM